MLSTHCAACGYTRMPMEGQGEACPRCDAPYTSQVVVREPVRSVPALPADPVDRAWALRNFSKLSPEQIARAAQRIHVSTTDTVLGMQGGKLLGIVSGIYTFAFGAVFEAVAGLGRDIVGSGSSPKTEMHLTKGIRYSTEVMQGHALALGADAIVGTKYSFEEFSGANNLGVIAVIATGTAIMYQASTHANAQ